MINLKGKKIKYYMKNVYGTDRFYLTNPREARNLQRLTKDKTMSIEHMQALKELADVEFEEVIPQKEIPV
jgi:phage-related protein